MADVGVWSAGDGLLTRLTRHFASSHRFLPARHPAQLSARPLALLLVAPDATALSGAGVIESPLALIPSSDPLLARAVRSSSAVSYGSGRKNTLTFSSLEPHRVSVALQRQIVTISGRLVEPMEWVLPYPAEACAPEEFLCLCGSLLLLDGDLNAST